MAISLGRLAVCMAASAALFFSGSAIAQQPPAAVPGAPVTAAPTPAPLGNNEAQVTVKPPVKPNKSPAIPSGAKAILEQWIDKDTPADAKVTTSSKGETYVLVASDEFNKDGRTFENGKDKFWTALDMPDVTNNALEYMSPDPKYATTKGGYLTLTITDEPREGVAYNGSTLKMAYTGAHLQSWNKFCFTGGIVKTRNKWPDGGGVWPATWFMGNLGRPQYEYSNEKMWPWNYNTCDEESKKWQKISACEKNPGFGLNPSQGRGAPEIDLLEAWCTDSPSYFASSLQLAPSIPANLRPTWSTVPNTTKGGLYSYYEDITYGYGYPEGVNQYYGHNEKGYWSNAVSGIIKITQDVKSQWNTYSVEWKLGKDGYVTFLFNEKDVIVSIPASSLTKKYCDPLDPANCSEPKFIPEEPMHSIINLGLASETAWGGGPKYAKFPAVFLVDYIRWYQLPDQINIGCDPPKYPTAKYIEAHPDLYGPNVEPRYPDKVFHFYSKNGAGSSAKATNGSSADDKNSAASGLSGAAAAAVLSIFSAGYLLARS